MLGGTQKVDRRQVSESSTVVGLLDKIENCANRRWSAGAGRNGSEAGGLGLAGRQRGGLTNQKGAKAKQVECTSGSGPEAQAETGLDRL